MNAVRAHELPTLLDRAPDGLRYLSLDCFDTLLWRDTNAPTDVFAGLTLDGGAIQPRRRAESAARRTIRYDTGRTEVSIETIHARFNPASDDAAAASPGGTPGTWSAYWTVTEHDHSSKVQSGENAGEFLKHDFVVRQYTAAGDYTADPKSPQKLTWRSIAATPGHARQINLVVFDPKTGKTLQAVSAGC